MCTALMIFVFLDTASSARAKRLFSAVGAAGPERLSHIGVHHAKNIDRIPLSLVELCYRLQVRFCQNAKGVISQTLFFALGQFHSSYNIFARPLHLPLRTMLVVESFTVSSNIVIDTPVSVLRYVGFTVLLFLGKKKPVSDKLFSFHEYFEHVPEISLCVSPQFYRRGCCAVPFQENQSQRRGLEKQ